MITEKAKRSDFPTLYTYGSRSMSFGFTQLEGMREVKRLSDISCETTFYKFPSKAEAIRFVDGILNHPRHEDDEWGVAMKDVFVLVAQYNSGDSSKEFLKVVPLDLDAINQA